MTAALRVLQRGHRVTILEAGDSVGMRAGSFEIEPGIWLEKFYHDMFKLEPAHCFADRGTQPRVEAPKASARDGAAVEGQGRSPRYSRRGGPVLWLARS